MGMLNAEGNAAKHAIIILSKGGAILYQLVTLNSVQFNFHATFKILENLHKGIGTSGRKCCTNIVPTLG